MGSSFSVCCNSTKQEANEVAVLSKRDWERLGGGELEHSLRNGLVKCVDSRFLVSLADQGHRIERMQDLPDRAFIGLEDLNKLGTYAAMITADGCRYSDTKVTKYEWLPIIILSYSWLGRSHPDPHGETLQIVVKALRRLKPHGVIIDFMSLPQVPRSKEEDKRFKEGLQEFNVFYSHPQTLVFQVTEFPAGYPSARSYDLPEGHTPAVYQQRGWCFAEACISSLGKTPKFLCNLSLLPEYGSDEVVGFCMNEYTPPPLPPSVFNEQLSQKTFTQKKTDLARVQKLYEDAFKSRIRDARNLLFAGVGWGTEEIRTFAEVIEVNQLAQHLDLSSNTVDEEGMRVLSRVLRLHQNLTSLTLESCQLSAAGARVLGEMLKVNTSLSTLEIGFGFREDGVAGALAEGLKVNTTLSTLDMKTNRSYDDGARALAEALKVNTAITTLDLSRNSIGTAGAWCLADALKVNTTLTTLILDDNVTLTYRGLYVDCLEEWLGDEGAEAMAEALKVNIGLTALSLAKNDIWDGAVALAEALKVNATLTTLNLRENEVHEHGGLALAEALKVNTTLTTLNLEVNFSVHGQGRQALVEAARPGCTVLF